MVSDEGITDDRYSHAQNVWNTFNIRSVGEYYDLYLKSDIVLSVDVFENLRKTFLQYYKLDPCQYFTSPGLPWDTMLKMTNVQLELMTDIDIFQFIEKGIHILPIDVEKPIINTRLDMIPKNHPSILCTWTLITFMVLQCLKACQQGNSNG